MMLKVEDATETCAHPLITPGDETRQWTTRLGETKIFCRETKEGVEISWRCTCKYRATPQPGPLTARLEQARRHRAR